MILSLPDDWHYSIRGLAKISKESPDSIGSGLKELEAAGYLTRRQLRGKRGRMGEIEYTFYEEPRAPNSRSPCTGFPDTVNPDTDKPHTDHPDTEKPAQLNKDTPNTERLNTEESNNRIYSHQEMAQISADEMGREREAYREIIKENIAYNILIMDYVNHDDIDEIVEIMLDTVCSTKPFIRVEGEDRPANVVKARLLKLDSEHIRYVLGCLSENTTKVRNIKQYLLAVLYNAPSTIGNYYRSKVNYDFYGKK